MFVLSLVVLSLLTPSYGVSDAGALSSQIDEKKDVDHSPKAAPKAAAASAVQQELLQLFVQLAAGADPEQMEKDVDAMSVKAAAAAKARAAPKATEVLASIDVQGRAALVATDGSITSGTSTASDETHEDPQKALQKLLEQRSLVRRDDSEDPASMAEEEAAAGLDKTLIKKSKIEKITITTPVPTPAPTAPPTNPPTKAPINCEWDRFETWAECSKSCGGGVKTREREKKRVEQYGGKECEGDETEERDCNIDDCPLPATTPLPLMEAGAMRTHYYSFAGIFVMLVLLRGRA